MRRVQPIQRRFRFQLRAFPGLAIPRNWLLRRVLYLLRHAHCLLTCDGGTSQKTTSVPITLTTIRVADTLAKKTYVFNEGGKAATIYENGVIVGISLPGTRLKLPLNGSMKLQAQTAEDTTNLRVLTYRRCLCGDALPPYDSGFVAAPETVTVTDTDYPAENTWTLAGEWTGARHTLQVWGAINGQRYLEIFTSASRSLASKIMSIDYGNGLYLSLDPHYLRFTYQGTTFTGTIQKSNLSHNSIHPPLPPFYYAHFTIQRTVPDIL